MLTKEQFRAPFAARKIRTRITTYESCQTVAEILVGEHTVEVRRDGKMLMFCEGTGGMNPTRAAEHVRKLGALADACAELRRLLTPAENAKP